jgi:hypothetical protein
VYISSKQTNFKEDTKMTYKQIYNQLDRAGLIDKILAATNYDKIGLIKGIRYLEYFIGTPMFKGMKYWNTRKGSAENMVCVEYAKLQIANKNKHLAPFEYMANVM